MISFADEAINQWHVVDRATLFYKIPSLVRSDETLRAFSLSAAAMFSVPSERRQLIDAFRRALKICGADLVATPGDT